MKNPLITLLTDFGNKDGFVGIMKGVILSICPDAKIIDISHEIEAQNVKQAGFVLMNSFRYFPEGTIHVVVVDPGVGSERKILAARAHTQIFLAPDNGLLTYVLEKSPAFKLINICNDKFFLPNVSHTFHGRDIFAPVAAHLANGIDVNELGTPDEDYFKIRIPGIEKGKNFLKGEVVYVDRFGNLITNISEESLPSNYQNIERIELGNHIINEIVDAYLNGDSSKPIAIIGSSGCLEIAINSKNASEHLNSTQGDEVTVVFKTDDIVIRS